VSLIADNEVPIWRGLQLRLERFGASAHVESHDEAVAFDEGVADDRCFYLLARDDIEGDVELFL
jgi:hypothetical protein